MQRMEKQDSVTGLNFIVLASPKSGTTWVQQMLCEHAQVHCAESRLFGQYFDPKVGSSVHLTLEQYVRFVSRYYNPPCGPDARDAYFDALLHRLIGTIASHAREESGKPIYGEKLTPYPGTARGVVQQLLEHDRELRLIHLVRDCRDVVVSGMAHWSRAMGSVGDHADPDEIFTKMLDTWVDVESAFERDRDQFEHVLEVRYEDLLIDPMAQAARVFEFIGADCPSGFLERCVERTSFATLSGGRQRGQVDDSSFYRCGTAGQWRDVLSTDQLDRIASIAGALMEARGYGHVARATRSASSTG